MSNTMQNATVSWLRGPLYWLIRQKERRLGYGWGIPLLTLWWDITLFTRTSDDTIILAARSPRWSLTWTWFVQIRSGRHGPGLHWQRRFGLILEPHRQYASIPIVLQLGGFHLSLHTQEAMPHRPGKRNHDPRQWERHVDKIARRRAKQAAVMERERYLASMNEGLFGNVATDPATTPLQDGGLRSAKACNAAWQSYMETHDLKGRSEDIIEAALSPFVAAWNAAWYAVRIDD